MSDKDRQKKNGQNKDKKNQRMRKSVAERQSKIMTERERQKHEAKMTNSIPEGAARLRKRSEKC
jgi:hypothetical protein